jgi:cytosine/adenosine deaminase-related metal-dependent hydrolase
VSHPPGRHALVISGATIQSEPGVVNIGIDGDRITAITTAPLDGADVIDAERGLVTESFVNARLHLDKVYTIDRVSEAAVTAYTGGVMDAAMTSIELASAVKDEYDEAWIEPNARRVLLDAVRYGTRHLLAFADADFVVHARPSLRGVLAHHEAPRHVIASGRIVATTTTTTTFDGRLSEPTASVGTPT